jgi:hypothetical protein
MAVRLDVSAPKSTRPSESTHAVTSALIQLNDVGLFMADQALVSGSKISPSGV